MRNTVFLIATLVLALSAMAAEPPKTPAEKYKALVDEFDAVGGARQFAEQFFALAANHPRDPVAVDALVWIVSNLRNRPDAKRALELLAKDHLDSDKLGPACRQIARTPSTAAEPLLRAAWDKSPHPAVRAEACWYLAQLLEQQATVVEQLKNHPELAGRILEYNGKEYGTYLASLNADKLAAQLEQVYIGMSKSFANVAKNDATMGEFAEQALFRWRHLSVGRVAPEIEGEDVDGQRFKLSDYRGKIVVLSFWGHW